MGKLNELLSIMISKLNASVKTEAQDLTEDQKAQARKNIGAVSAEYVDNKTCIIKNLPSHEYELTIRDGCIVQLGGYIYKSDTAVCAETPVTPGDVITITGHQWQSSYNYYLYYFYDEDGNVISYEEGDGDNKKSTRTVTVPQNAVRLLVNGIVHSPITVVGEQTIIIDLGYVVSEIEKLKTLPSRKLITLGDSITALGTGNTGWVKYFIEKTGCTLVANTAVNSAVLSDKTGTVYDGNPVWNGSDNNVNNVLGNQVQKIVNNAYDAPDIIMIAIGTNGGISITKDQIKAAYYDSNNALIPLENVDRTTNAGAYRWCLDKLHETYPNAIIFWCAPIMGYQTTRSAENAMTFAESLKIATEYTGQIMIDTNRCGINGINEFDGSNGEYLADGLHPNAKGAKKMGYYMASKVLPFLDGGFVDG